MNSLARQTVLGFVGLLVAMGLMLFVAAGTLNFWQAWLYLLVFFGSAGAITVYLWRTDRALLERRVRAGPVAETQPLQRLIQAMASLTFIGFLVIPGLDHRFAWSQVPAAISVAAAALAAFGFWGILAVFRENSYTAATIQVATNQAVISTGAYAVVRHPMYAAALVLLLATPLALGSWWGLLLVFPMTVLLALRLLDEERYLAEHLPGYTDYCRRVRYRLIPQVW